MVARYCLAALVVFGMLAGGCRKRGVETYKPPEGTAREALDAALSAWKGGNAKPDELKLGKIGLVVMDAAWSSGQKLSDFQIVNEETGTEAVRWFTVKLKLDKSEQTVKYAVVGKDPIWVYSETEYKKVGG